MTLHVFSPVHVTPIPVPEPARHLAARLASVVVFSDASHLPAAEHNVVVVLAVVNTLAGTAKLDR